MRSESSYSNVGKQTAYQACQPVPASNGRLGDDRANRRFHSAERRPGATTAIPSHTARRIHGTKDGRMNTGSSDIFTVPYNDGKGGTASPVNGRRLEQETSTTPPSRPTTSSSPSTSWDQTTSCMSSRMRRSGSFPRTAEPLTRLASNDPPSCTGVKSPGRSELVAEVGPAQDCSNVRRRRKPPITG